jgi:hypothetical protein
MTLLTLLQSSSIVPPQPEETQLIGPPASDYTYYDKKRQAAYNAHRRRLIQLRNLNILMLSL